MILYLYNNQSKKYIVTSRTAMQCMSSSHERAALHGISIPNTSAIHSRPYFSDEEKAEWETEVRARIYIYETIEQLIEDEIRIGVPDAEIQKIPTKK